MIWAVEYVDSTKSELLLVSIAFELGEVVISDKIIYRGTVKWIDPDRKQYYKITDEWSGLEEDTDFYECEASTFEEFVELHPEVFL